MALGLRSFVKSCSRLLRLARKPSGSELWLTIKICSVGIILVGMIGFIIKLLSAFIGTVFQG
ncbi:protein translocase SEC61 complex subunit gamma [Candidatus Bathyarchaeota archaeon]|nr:MAG: protein translocase SEC61 complex subunit gamma [Candidatus Bathyarchaeota archaeon]